MKALPILTAADFRNGRHAASHALEAAMAVIDVLRVMTLALSTEEGTLTVQSQEALRTVARYGLGMAEEARDAADFANVLGSTER